MNIALRDPTGRTSAVPTPLERIAATFIRDPRDTPFLSLMAITTATVIPTGLLLFVPGAFRWWLAAAHVALFLYFVGPFVLMLHCTSHRKLFKAPWSWLNVYIPWVLGPFFGETPSTYFAHHVGMHHPENNLADDVSSTMPFQRDSVVDFARYFLRFLFLVLVDLTAYLVRRGRRGLMARTLFGEATFVAACVGLMWVNWRATLVVFVVPFVVTRFAMMAGNWAQHAFIDAEAPGNCYRNSITCINSSYNRRCFNDGYHIGHHIKQTRHWTELPDDFRTNTARYQAEGAIVFEGLDFFLVWAALMVKGYGWLAERYVHLGDERPTRDEIIALLRTRTARIG